MTLRATSTGKINSEEGTGKEDFYSGCWFARHYHPFLEKHLDRLKLETYRLLPKLFSCVIYAFHVEMKKITEKPIRMTGLWADIPKSIHQTAVMGWIS
jgi:hypothetical protein